MRAASNFAVSINDSFYYIIGVCLFLFIGLTTVMIYFIIKYNIRRHPKAKQIKDNLMLEFTWTLLPLLIVISMFFVGYYSYNPMNFPPKDAMKVKVTAMMWNWNFQYENGKESKVLMLPLNKAVVLNLESKDVIHSCFIPAFRIKQDIVPGKPDIKMWFVPLIKDTFDMFCSQYCGIDHSHMITKTIVMDPKDFDKWLAEVPVKSAAEDMPGFKLIKDNACVGCHSLDGSRIVGPSFKGLYGSDQVVTLDGKDKTVKADDKYLKAKILGDGKSVVKTYPPGVMKAFKGVIKDEEINQIIDFIKTQK